MKVFVEGELRTTEWKDKSDRVQFSIGVYASRCNILTSKETDDTQPELSEETTVERGIATLREVLAAQKH